MLTKKNVQRLTKNSNNFYDATLLEKNANIAVFRCKAMALMPLKPERVLELNYFNGMIKWVVSRLANWRILLLLKGTL